MGRSTLSIPGVLLFGQGSQVNVLGGLVASTLDMNDSSLSSAARAFAGWHWQWQHR
jgi:hypothetical protein